MFITSRALRAAIDPAIEHIIYVMIDHQLLTQAQQPKILNSLSAQRASIVFARSEFVAVQQHTGQDPIDIAATNRLTGRSRRVADPFACLLQIEGVGCEIGSDKMEQKLVVRWAQERSASDIMDLRGD